jgi:SAM-dependent methyltransferase
MPADVARYGPDIPTESELKLCGNVEGKRVLELGTGTQTSIAFAKQGGHTIAVDSSPERIAALKRRCEEEDLKVELHESDLADLAFVRADSVDLAFSALAFDQVEDLNRVFRQVHRVLRQDAPLVFSVSHPAYALIGDEAEEPLLVRRSYFDRDSVEPEGAGSFHRTISELFTGLTRANFRVDTILEPAPVTAGPHSPEWREAFRYVPRTLIVRARKEGI